MMVLLYSGSPGQVVEIMFGSSSFSSPRRGVVRDIGLGWRALPS